MAEPTEQTPRNYCMEADHYTKCPRFRKDCDGISCESNGYTWQEIEARRGHVTMPVTKRARKKSVG